MPSQQDNFFAVSNESKDESPKPSTPSPAPVQAPAPPPMPPPQIYYPQPPQQAYPPLLPFRPHWEPGLRLSIAFQFVFLVPAAFALGYELFYYLPGTPREFERLSYGAVREYINPNAPLIGMAFSLAVILMLLGQVLLAIHAELRKRNH